MRTIAIGDIHGCLEPLRNLLALIQPAPDDHIVTLGDYVDRGPDSRGVIDLLIELEGHCRLTAIFGNHDFALREFLRGQVPLEELHLMGGIPTLESYGLDPSDPQIDRFPAAHLDFLDRTCDWLETDDHLFLHAYYFPHLPMDQHPFDVLRWQSLRQSVPGPHRSGKRAIVGHTSQKNGKVWDLGHLVCIDTYCYGGGKLTALDVQANEIWQVAGLKSRSPQDR